MSFFRNIFRALSKIERRVFFAAVALVAIGVIGLIVIFIKNHTVVLPAHSGTYTEGMVGQPSYVNPVLAATDQDQALTQLTFADLQQLSDAIQTSADGSTIEVHLKEGLTWSDGQPLTSDDVIFTLQSIQDPDSRSPLAGLFEGVTADRVSALEVDFRPDEPRAGLGHHLAPAAAAAHLERYSAGELAPFRLQPGPGLQRSVCGRIAQHRR